MPCRKGCGPQWWHGKVKDCGYRITAGREAIIEALSVTHDHLSAEDVYVRIHDKYPNVGLTTIYRTLDMLVNLGLVFKFDFGDGKSRYELTEGPKGSHHHHHLVCTGCKRVIDYTDFIDDEVELLRRTEKGLSDKYRFRIDNHLIQFYGTCTECLAK
ncbi:MAG: Fur family transcriptional regulator [Candidatus Omnitrophota bacterium]